MASGPRFLPSMRTASRGMAAQRRKLAAATENLANANTSRTADGDPYALKRVAQQAGDGRGRFDQSLSDATLELRTPAAACSWSAGRTTWVRQRRSAR